MPGLVCGGERFELRYICSVSDSLKLSKGNLYSKSYFKHVAIQFANADIEVGKPMHRDCLALCLDCMYGQYWFRLSRLSMMVIGSFASYTKTKSVESAV
jgi:hypothetical protein